MAFDCDDELRLESASVGVPVPNGTVESKVDDIVALPLVTARDEQKYREQVCSQWTFQVEIQCNARYATNAE